VDISRDVSQRLTILYRLRARDNRFECILVTESQRGRFFVPVHAHPSLTRRIMFSANCTLQLRSPFSEASHPPDHLRAVVLNTSSAPRDLRPTQFVPSVYRAPAFMRSRTHILQRMGCRQPLTRPDELTSLAISDCPFSCLAELAESDLTIPSLT